MLDDPEEIEVRSERRRYGGREGDCIHGLVNILFDGIFSQEGMPTPMVQPSLVGEAEISDRKDDEVEGG